MCDLQQVDHVLNMLLLAGTYANNHMVMHGLWPDYGAPVTPAQGFSSPPSPPFYNGSYQVRWHDVMPHV